MNPIMRYFQYQHLPDQLQRASAPIAMLANVMDTLLPNCAEKSAGMRKLLEAKDCFVRAFMEQLENESSNKLNNEEQK